MNLLVPSTLLRRALQADAAGSLGMAALQLAAPAALAAQTALPAALLTGSGSVMGAYGVALLLMAARARLPRVLVLAVIAGNVAWALGALTAAAALAPAAAGMALLAVHALWVLSFAALQRTGLSRSAPGSGHNGPIDGPTPRTR